MWKHSTREFGHTCKSRDSAFEASRTFGTTPQPRREETRVGQKCRAAEKCKIRTSERTNFHVQSIPTYDLLREGETLYRGYKKRRIRRRQRLANHAEPMRDI